MSLSDNYHKLVEERKKEQSRLDIEWRTRKTKAWTGFAKSTGQK